MDKISRMIMFLTFCLLVTSSLESPLAAQTRRMTARKRAAQDNVLLASRLIAENKHEQAYGILNDVIENLDKKNAQAYYYLALICTESEKFRDAEKAKSFISQAEENGLDYVELGLKPIGGLKTVKVTVLEPNAETSSDTLAGPQSQAKTQAILEPSKPTASDTSVARKEEKPELAAVPPAKTVAEPVEQEPVEATAVPPEAAGAEHGSSGLPAVAAPLPTQSVVKTLPLPEVSSRPAKAVSEPAPQSGRTGKKQHPGPECRAGRRHSAGFAHPRDNCPANAPGAGSPSRASYTVNPLGRKSTDERFYLRCTLGDGTDHHQGITGAAADLQRELD